MDNSGAFLNPGASPNGLVSVRRLNHLPLYILGGLAIGIVLMIIWVAADKSRPPSDKKEDHGGSSDSYAQQVVGDRHGYVPAVRAPTPWPTMAPALVASTPVATPDDSEEKARRTAFYTALGAPSAVQDQPASAPSSVEEAPAVPPQTSVPYPDLSRLIPAPSATPIDPNLLSNYDGSKDRWKSSGRVEPPVSPYVLQTGWVIPALLISGMESELPGAIIAQVSQDVFDSPSGKFLLIPKGSRLFGEYANSIAYGQSRIFVAWQRIIFPNGNTLDIGAQEGGDAQGEAGFHDQVNNHLLTIFGSALLMSAITGGIAISQPNYQNQSSPNAESTLSAALGQSLGQATSQLLEKNVSVPPTLRIRQGYRFSVVCVKDLVFNRPYVVPNY